MNKKAALRIHGRNPEGLFHWREDLLDGASGTGAVLSSGEERSDVVNKETEGNEDADHGTTGLDDGVEHRTRLLS